MLLALKAFLREAYSLSTARIEQFASDAQAAGGSDVGPDRREQPLRRNEALLRSPASPFDALQLDLSRPELLVRQFRALMKSDKQDLATYVAQPALATSRARRRNPHAGSSSKPRGKKTSSRGSMRPRGRKKRRVDDDSDGDEEDGEQDEEDDRDELEDGEDS